MTCELGIMSPLISLADQCKQMTKRRRKIIAQNSEFQLNNKLSMRFFDYRNQNEK